MSDVQAFAMWITGLPASGKSTIARAVVQELKARDIDIAVLESDVFRDVLTPHPTYSEEERAQFYRSLAYVGALLVRHGVPVIFDGTANRRVYRDAARATIDRFIEVYVDCPLGVCMARDPKGVYRKAQSGQASSVPGLQAAYEPPEHPDVIVSGGEGGPELAAHAIVRVLEDKAYVPRPLVAAGR